MRRVAKVRIVKKAGGGQAIRCGPCGPGNDSGGPPMPQKRDMEHPASLERDTGQHQVFGGASAGFGDLFEGGVTAVERAFGLFAVEDLLDGENLNARIAGTIGDL